MTEKTFDNSFKEELTNRISNINKILNDLMPNDASFIETEKYMYEKILSSVRYSVEAGGKRLRPLLMSLAYELCAIEERDDEKDFLFSCMAAMEFIHTYSLVHDDLPAMDNDVLRRGKPTTHIKYGEDFGILAGDALLNFAYELILKTLTKNFDEKKIRAASILSEKAGIFGMVAGQGLDVQLTGNPLSESELNFIFKKKTAALIEACFMIGATLARRSEEEVFKIEKAGEKLGFAFQIRDDILDEIGDEEEIGKPIKSDLKNEKTTYVTTYGLKKAQEDVKRLSNEAKEILKEFGEHKFLLDLIDYMVMRKS